jgi:arginase family enzyme
MTPSTETLILDFDRSVKLPGNPCHKLDLHRYEEKIRYCASMHMMHELECEIIDEIRRHRIFLLGNGDFHHLSYLLIKNMPHQNLHVAVFDNHPDNMFFPAGIHCGSWVYHASKLPHVAEISVFGIASGDMKGLNIVQHRLSAIRSGKVKYYCVSPVGRIMKLAGSPHIKEIGTDYRSILQVVEERLLPLNTPIYLSIDKDVLASDDILTTWDQGRLSEDDLMKCIEMLSPRVVAADITGDISSYTFQSLLKKILRWVDGAARTPAFTTEDLQKHQALNLKILSFLTQKKNS